MRLIYLSCSKWCPSATIHIWTRDCTLYNITGDTLAQASVIRFRSACNVGARVAYTRCLMYPHRKIPIGSGQVNMEAILRNQHTRWLVAGMCPECTVV
ncbi:hypothetical protein AVEN_209570-1 [Araneus ventricosus]|uniref:Uncharacterized protein n=1 Tax=Araneus ventricosus TaxID=182803 RepID=A0A4Y2HHA8_ARAVE|nr:hypothetical protein AVEN_197482-1 [Araneus ventricosus]GBM63512.1 hypothetical protein AVEN_232072-1 [Araneus ventricosus]GBM64715.1 hypothetical protein AVEN_173169-1 [Araneus ventricosus]GBM64996.1 hypothetical protein AVEN_209570-1 [Araneus ventricosus]